MPDLHDTVQTMLQICQKGQVSRAEYECAIAANDEPSFAACGVRH